MHVDIEVVLTMPRILYLLSQTCKHPALYFSLAAHLVARMGGHSSSILRNLFTAGLQPSLIQTEVRDVVITYINFTFSGLNQARILNFCTIYFGAKIAFLYEDGNSEENLGP